MRLSASNAHASLPYDRATVTPGIVHLGIGAFHRAHMAVYIDDLLGRDPSWGIIGASLRRGDTRAALAPQDFLYTLAIRDSAGTRTRVIGSILDVLDAQTQRETLIETLADPRIRIVSLTVTEKGYCHDPATDTLDPAHPDIVHDLTHPDAPISAPGLIVRAIELRKAAGVAPFSVMSCDNLPANGATVRRVVVALAALRSADLAAYIEAKVAFPASMVDRIVPATTDADRAEVSALVGFDDGWPVVTESFSQWVIEDNFVNGRPDFGAVGAEMVADVAPFEHMKLRMLNGSHSTLAYLGYLAGYQHVSDAIADPDLRRLIAGLMTEEVIPTLPMSADMLSAYRDRLLERFANPALKHRTWQIAMDGSQKLPQRLLGTIRDRIAAGRSFDRLALGVAAWMRYVTGIDESGQPIEVKDPLAPRLRQIADAANRSPETLAAGLLAVREIFSELGTNTQLWEALVGHLDALFRTGAKATARSAGG